ncbi:hypothetical protein Hanom_Chr05g00399321 [Helianthus anomalus]
MGFDKIESDIKWVYSLHSWYTKEWLVKSKTGSSNWKSGDMNCARASSRHTGCYLEAMHDLHGSDFTEVPDDPEVWVRVQARGPRNRVYGVGSSNLDYMVTGTSSSSRRCASPSIDYQRSQEEVLKRKTWSSYLKKTGFRVGSK